MKKKISLFFITFILGIIVGVYFFSNFKVANLLLERIFGKETIAANLTKEGNVSCNISLAWAPDVFFVGDSHTGSGWDFKKISKKIDRKVGACIIGGATFVDLVRLTQIYATNSKSSPVIIIGGAPRQFWIGENSHERKKQVEEIFRRMIDPQNFWVHTFPRIVFFDQFKKGSYNRNKKLFQDLENFFVLEGKDKILNLLKNSPQNSLKKWEDRIEKAEVDNSYTNFLYDLCEIQRNRIARIIFTYIPESPSLQKMYGKKEWIPINDVSKKMLECGITVLSKINEKKFSDLEFLKYFEPQKYENFFSSKNGLPKDILDADHMNFIGAQIHTDLFLSKPEIKKLFQLE